MYIEPNSTLYILKNCPLDTTYDHTLYFNKDNPDIGKLNQSNYFASLAKYKLSSETGEPLSYVRTARGAVKVPFKADDLYDCNYIMYRNIGFGNKWFYAFIKSVDYINTVTSQINFEIDVMQTWMFDYEIDMCFVEREHSYTDVPGQNTLPENVDLGDYFSTGNFGTGVLKDWRIVVVRTAKTETAGYTTVTGAFYNGTYQQVEFDTWEPNETALDKIKGLLDALSVFNHQDTVIGIYLMPAALIPPKRTNLADSFADGRRTTEQGVQICTRPETLARGYIPKNKKLLTYPYCYLSCTNFEGSEKVYKYEYFRDKTGVNIQQQIRFVVYSDIGVRPTIMIAPINYMAYWEGEEYQPNPEEGITLSNIPQASWATSDAGAKFFQALTSIAMLGTGATIPETATKVETTQTRNPATGRLNITSRTTVSRPEQEVPGVTGKDIAKELARGYVYRCQFCYWCW